MNNKLRLDIERVFKNGKNHYKKRIQSKYPDSSLIFRKKSPVLIFGAARMGRVFLANLKKNEIPVLGFIDNNKKIQGSKIDGVKVISFREAQSKYRLHPVLIASLLYETEIYNLLRKANFKNVYPLVYLNLINPDIFVSPEYHDTFNSLFVNKNQKDILTLFSLLSDKKSEKVFYDLFLFRLTTEKIYIHKAESSKKLFFEKDVMPLSNNEVFVDCGAYNGDSVESFIKSVSGKFNKIYSFEPDKENFKNLNEKIKKNTWENIITVKKGVFNKNGKVSFNGAGTVDARISTKESVELAKSTIEVITIDSYFKSKEPPTLIKMDIEGAEIEALLGAKKTIKKYKPKLAISSYHRSTDLWKIPLLIKSMNKDYKIYFRHYSNELPDTICYAI